MGEDSDALPIDPTDRAGPSPRPSTGVSARRWRRPEAAVLVAIGCGGMLGATARFELAQALPVGTGQFPWATFWTNTSGSFLLGVLLSVLLGRPPNRLLRPFLATGILGAFTTMSTYQVETALLLKDGHAGLAMLYAIGSLAAGLGLAGAGIVCGRSATLGRRTQR